MSIFTNTWDWFNGKKTVIGCVLLLVGTVATGGVPLIPAIPALAPAVPYILGLGTLLGGTGLAHKTLKAVGASAELPPASQP